MDMQGLVHRQQTNSTETGGDVLDWLKSAGGQAFEFVSSVVTKHGPVVVERAAPIVSAALEQALSNYLNTAFASKKRK